MDNMPRTSFEFLAFEQGSQKLLAYGATAESATQWASNVSPTAEIKVLPAGQFGRTIWNRKFPLVMAWRALKWAGNTTGLGAIEPRHTDQARSNGGRVKRRRPKVSI